MGNLNNFVWTNFGSDDDEFQVFLPFEFFFPGKNLAQLLQTSKDCSGF